MLENDNGCDRCRDYDKVREELENTKRKSTEDQKNALKRCEDSKSQLQKKLLSVGAAAVIGGTILGKDLVDKIAEYIESFNTVKNAANGLVGMADPPVDVPIVEVKEEPKEETEEDKKDPVDTKPRLAKAFPVLSLPDWSLDVPMLTGDRYGSSLSDIILASEMNSITPSSLLDVSEDLSNLMAAFQIDDMITWDVPPLMLTDLPVYYDMGMPMERAAIVPEVGAWTPMLFLPIAFHPRRRRR